mmetsp:Transcript_39118/g.72918  ORF Transcript_39118/g.72918 Transcript_39118/m.72918 type:complete len:149 (+) Transcript_39118:38-484(+)
MSTGPSAGLSSGPGQGSTSTPRGKKPSRRAVDGQARMKQLCQHGAVAAASPAAINRCAVPGPGTYTTTSRTEEMIKPVNCRVLMSRRPRFQKEGALFNPGIEAKVPGPGTYDADKILSLGSCKVSKEKDPPKWTMAKKSIMEFAKTHC